MAVRVIAQGLTRKKEREKGEGREFDASRHGERPVKVKVKVKRMAITDRMQPRYRAIAVQRSARNFMGLVHHQVQARHHVRRDLKLSGESDPPSWDRLSYTAVRP